MARTPEDRRYRRMARPGLVDMARRREERAEAPEIAMPDMPDYPYGLCLALSHEELEKQKLEAGDFRVGDIVDLRALARVTSVSETSVDGGEMHCRVELQITHLALENESAEQPGEMA